MKARFFLSSSLLLLMTLVGCSTATPPTPQASVSPTSTATPQTVQGSPSPTPATESPSPSPVSETISESQKISATGIGPAKLGMTLGELKKELGSKAEFKVQSPYIVDFDAIAVSQNGKVQYYILYPAGKPLTDSGKIDALVTENSDYKTEKGVGPGTSLKQAEAAYGDATLSYNLDNEGREYVRFANQPAKSISFRLGNANDASLIGVYSSKSGSGGLSETKQFKDAASIRSVEVN
ncbi:DUF3558 domain-containing protein [Coleofasciculus sp. FACHB-129]|uniref:DUF3558 domain-containing protein n=1 Tax=Cyanophyceae TaxID=3028117 RepID=UPI001F54B447|nr:DUF3558 domain-containing protein [Coleofasciculus sp. FACHB-129]